MCLGLSYLGSSVLPIPGYVSFFRFEKFSAIVSSNIFLIPFPFSSPSKTPIIYRSASFTASWCHSGHQCWSLSTLFVSKPAPVHVSQAKFRPLQLPICPSGPSRQWKGFPERGNLSSSTVSSQGSRSILILFFSFSFSFHTTWLQGDLPWSFLLHQLSSGILW